MRLKELREKTNKTQTEIAEILNTTQGTYGKYERGELKIDLYSLIKLSDYYNVSLDYLCDHNTKTQQFPPLTNEQSQAVNVLTKLNSINLLKAYSYICGLYASQN